MLLTPGFPDVERPEAVSCLDESLTSIFDKTNKKGAGCKAVASAKGARAVYSTRTGIRARMPKFSPPVWPLGS